MPTGLDSESLRKALQWISEERSCKPNTALHVLFDETCLRFDLTPLECNELYKLVFTKPKD